MSERFVESSEFARSLPRVDCFGGRSGSEAARAAVRRHCGHSDMATAALGYLNGLSLAGVATMMSVTEGRAHDLILAADRYLLRTRTKQQGRQAVQAARPARAKPLELAIEQPATPLSEDEHWQNQAARKSEDPELFFPVGNSGAAREQAQHAKDVCGRCEVQLACAAFALEKDQQFGIWGGMTEDERALLKRARKKTI